VYVLCVCAVFGSAGAHIFSNRTGFANTYGAVYLAHAWTWRAFLPWAPTLAALRPMFLIVSDGRVAAPVLDAPGVWVKTQTATGVLFPLAGRAVTNQNGAAARRQRRLVTRALVSRTDLDAWVRDAAADLMASLRTACAAAGADPGRGPAIARGQGAEGSTGAAALAAEVDVVPLLQAATFALLSRVVFGPLEPGLDGSFRDAFLDLWSHYRQNTAGWSAKAVAGHVQVCVLCVSHVRLCVKPF
jgi:hypothetical protein